ncbi:MAG: hypothetical protein VB075_13690 [Petrimonas sp.]|uniref:hypothetical protein n=1 Tax=Petrimonas sp. TaxID=2023866 RepID=UPI002B366ED9|nr:hypothetical protein [Petrimonas sp.]MEA4979912.1 hypothetical protein [Petrimonas sp.]MEA5045602.1 hypothetical protein [Petrimonas sp.]
MNTISLEARKRMIAEDIPNVNDASSLEKIEKIIKKFSQSVNRFTVEELEERAEKSEKAIEEDRVFTTDEVRKKLGL